MNISRCGWANFSELEIDYHDKQWGVPVHDDFVHFEFLLLEGAQAGLSWHTILQKRKNYQTAFKGFDPVKIANFKDKQIQSLLNNPGIVRNRLKINSAVTNAQRFLEIKRNMAALMLYLELCGWQTIMNKWDDIKQVPASTELSKTISKDLIKAGFKFVGPTIMYSYLQSNGAYQRSPHQLFSISRDLRHEVRK